MIALRKSQERGHANHGWLDSYHSFSFAEYYDPKHMGFSVLRVINDDKVAGNAGFGMHPHRDMEIITYMLSGALRHQDSMGNGSIIKAGDVQRMTAGTGVRHSEINATDEEVHLLQIWIVPEQNNLPPSYQDKTIPLESKRNRWCLVAARDNHEAALKVHQDMALWATVLGAQQTLDYPILTNRSVYLHVAKGQLTVNGLDLVTGDALMVVDEAELHLLATQETEVLLFDLPEHL